MEAHLVQADLDAKLTYLQIANKYGVPRNTVASFIRRKIHGKSDLEYTERKKYELQMQRRQKPSMPYVPGVTEDGKKWFDEDERRKETPKDGEDRGKEAGVREASALR